MGLQLNGKYWRIMGDQRYYTDRLMDITVHQYNNRDEVSHISYIGYRIDFNQLGSNVYDPTREMLYDYVKSQDEFQGASDIFEYQLEYPAWDLGIAEAEVPGWWMRFKNYMKEKNK